LKTSFRYSTQESRQLAVFGLLRFVKVTW